MTKRRNAPLKGARQIGSNMTEVEHGDLTVLYSYETPVAFLSPRGGYVTEKRWSVTTAKHIAKFFDRHGYDKKGAHKIPQEDIEMFVATGKGPQDNPRARRSGRKGLNLQFDDRDVGCYIDGALGTGHAVQKMADLLGDLGTGKANTLLEEYDDDAIDDEFEQEWLDDATEALQEVTKDGLVWEWDGGDLCLREAEE